MTGGLAAVVVVLISREHAKWVASQPPGSAER